MGRFFRDEYGQPCLFPHGQAAAKRERSSKFMTKEGCSICGKFVFFTKNARCIHCARLDAGDLYALCVGAMTLYGYEDGTWSTYYNPDRRTGKRVGCRHVSNEYRDELEAMRDLATHEGVVHADAQKAYAAGAKLWIRPEPCAKLGHYGVRTIRGECYFCEQERNKVSPRKAAVLAGDTWYTPDTPCKRCGEIALRSVLNGSCKACAPDRGTSPRRQAILAGETWYTPTTPCKHCGTIALRNVRNGSCKGCKPATGAPGPDNRKTPDTIMMEAQPDMVISRDQARALGLKVYRTGEPCRKDHRGFRYVSTGNCLMCLGRG